MKNMQNGLRSWRRFCGRIVGCVSLFLAFAADCPVSHVALGAASEEAFIAVRNPRTLPPQISAERIPLGISGDYKPSLALLPDGDLLLVMFNQVDKGGGKVREEMIHFRSADGGKTWGERQVLPLLGREPYFSVLRDGTLFLTTHLSSRDVLNPDGYVHSYVHRSADGGKTWSTLRIGSEDVPGVAEKTWTHTSRNVLELRDGTVILGVSAGSSTDYLWRSKDKGQTWDKSLVCTVEGFEVKKQGFPWHAETVFWQAGNGDILAIARCHSGALPALGNTEIPEGNDNVERMALFRSRNGGGTWTLEAEMGNDYAEHYQAILRLQDERLLFTFTVRALRPPLGLRAVLGTETADGFKFEFRSDRLVLDEKTPADKPSGGGFGNTVQLSNGQLVSAYTYRGEDGNVHAEVLRWALP
ncbi:MAG: sialidase family protein [Planctomycetota bacterium]|nr:sialidase family protein [Planctomycetota bacterium]